MWDRTAREHNKLGLTSLFWIFLHTANAEHTTPRAPTQQCAKSFVCNQFNTLDSSFCNGKLGCSSCLSFTLLFSPSLFFHFHCHRVFGFGEVGVYWWKKVWMFNPKVWFWTFVSHTSSLEQIVNLLWNFHCGVRRFGLNSLEKKKKP